MLLLVPPKFEVVTIYVVSCCFVVLNVTISETLRPLHSSSTLNRLGSSFAVTAINSVRGWAAPVYWVVRTAAYQIAYPRLQGPNSKQEHRHSLPHLNSTSSVILKCCRHDIISNPSEILIEVSGAPWTVISIWKHCSKAQIMFILASPNQKQHKLYLWLKV